MMSNISSEWPKPGWLQRTLYGDGEGALREIGWCIVVQSAIDRVRTATLFGTASK